MRVRYLRRPTGSHGMRFAPGSYQSASYHMTRVFEFLSDAEETWIQDAIDHLAEEMMRKFNSTRAIIYNTVQLYRKDRLDYLNRMLVASVADRFFLGFKLVRGAYMEKERVHALAAGKVSPVFEEKADSDRCFDDALTFCIKHFDRIAIAAGTHNENSTQLLAQLIEKYAIAKNDPKIFFSQLLGMGDHLSFNLANEGYNVAKYVPYGPVREVMPYLFRRAEENTSIQGQTGRELSLIKKERARRSKLR